MWKKTQQKADKVVKYNKQYDNYPTRTKKINVK